jgi:hypothetical protein
VARPARLFLAAYFGIVVRTQAMTDRRPARRSPRRAGGKPGRSPQPGIAAAATTLYLYETNSSVWPGTEPAVSIAAARAHGQRDERSFLLQRVQPAMTGLIDGSLSTLAPIFAVAFARAWPGHGRPAPRASLICWPQK